MPTSTPYQAFPVPVAGDDPNIPDDMLQLAIAIEKRVIGVYASTVDRDAKITAPTNGIFALTTDTYTVWNYQTTWKQVIPPPGLPTFSNGTTVPPNSSGANGDIFFKV